MEIDLDTCIAAAAAFSQAATAYLGFRVTLTPPAVPARKIAYECAFTAVGLLGVCLVIIAAVRAGNIQKSVSIELATIKNGVDRLLLGSAKPGAPTRTLTAADQQNIIEGLKPFALTSGTVTVGCAVYSVNACSYAAQWLDVIQRSGWKVGPKEGARVLAQIYQPPFNGVRISVGAQETPGGGFIQKAFKTVGIDAFGVLDPSLKTDEILIAIGGNE